MLSINDIPEVISAECIAENKHVNRLYSEEKDLNTIVFQNRDGGKTIYLFNEPIKYIDNQGNIKDKSTKIKQVEQTNLSSVKTDIAYIVDDNKYDPQFSNRDGGYSIIGNSAYHVNYVSFIGYYSVTPLSNHYN